MAEARSEEEEDTVRETREPAVRRQPNPSRGRSDHRKPDRRLSQGPLASIRAVIKRTTRSTSVSESPPDQDQNREQNRDRRRPEITILSAEPLASTSWFPGASGGFPPPPPPAPPTWGPTIPPFVQPPPSYEEVIREKTQEQALLPSCSASSITIATQTDPPSYSNPSEPQVRRPVRPPRPRLSYPPQLSRVDDITSSHSATLITQPEAEPPTAPCCDLTDPCSPLSSGADLWDPPPASPCTYVERPRPRPRSSLSVQPISSEIRIQTLVRLCDESEDRLAANASSGSWNQEVSPGRYLQELLEAFSSDDWGVAEHRSSQSEGEEADEGAEQEDVANMEARIQQAADDKDPAPKRPEPRPRPRLQGRPAKSAPPTVAPKPKTFCHAPKPSTKLFWEDDSPAVTDPVPEPPQSESPSPVPAPRPPPPKITSSLSETSLANPKPAPRLPVAPRATAKEKPLPSLPPRRSLDLGGGTRTQTVKAGSVRPEVPAKPAALTSPRCASAPNLVPQTSEAPNPVLPQPTAATPKPSGPGPDPGPAPVHGPAPALRKSPVVQTKPESSCPSNPDSSPRVPPRPSGVKLLPLRPPPMKAVPGRPPPPAVDQMAPSPSKAGPVASQTAGSQAPSSVSANQVSSVATGPERASKRGPPLPPRPKPGHPLYNSYTEVLIVLDDPEDQSGEGRSQTAVRPPISQPQCLLHVRTDDSLSKPALEDLGQSESKVHKSILLLPPSEQKELPDAPPISGPRCVALFDYEGEQNDELTFSQGDVIALLELIGQEWGRGQIHGRMGMFPLSFTQVVEALPQATPPTELQTSRDQNSEEEWAVALFDFPGQTEEDLPFHKGALIQVTQYVDTDWRKGRLDGREGLYPVAFTQRCHAQPIAGQQSAVMVVAKSDVTTKSEDEVTLKACHVIGSTPPDE
ncbi:SH3 domain-containing protein 19-like isoform X2 [Antennarius striatus]|uniref:SH3 domain-containing protein 19-like isoform X2 n=1 Tax=Antennarius striatus TaxID=241820 RepID=UPI0035B38B98